MNPFAILGLNSTVLLGISDEDVQSLLQSSFKALSRVHHPDKGGNPRVFNLIKEAYDSLKDDEYRAEMLTQYLLPKSDLLSESEAEVARLEQGFDCYLESLQEARLYDGLSILSPVGTTLILRANNAESPEVDKDYVVIRVNEAGIEISQLVCDEDSLDEEEIPDFASMLSNSTWGFVGEHFPCDGFYELGYFFKNDQTPLRYALNKGNKQHGYRFFEAPAKQAYLTLVGSIPEDDMLDVARNAKASPALSVGVPGIVKSKQFKQKFDETAVVSMDGFTHTRIKPYLRNLTARFSVNNYLLAADITNGRVRYYVLGQIQECIELEGTDVGQQGGINASTTI